MKDVMGYRTFDNKYCAWVRSHKPAACTRTLRNLPKFNSVDLLLTPKFPHRSQLENCSEGQELLETVFPVADREKHVHPVRRIPIDENGDITLNRPHCYYMQVQEQLAISGVTLWCGL